jgi:endonuclease YncB( thermonuclease family)
LFFFFSNEDETEVAVQGKKDIFILTSNQVVDVYDGDTFKIDLPSMHPLFGDDLSIRLFGVDTPEMRGTTDEVKALAMQAQELAENALKGASRKNCGILKEGSIFALYARCGSMENRLPVCSRQRVWRRTMMGRGLGRSGERG